MCTAVMGRYSLQQTQRSVSFLSVLVSLSHISCQGHAAMYCSSETASLGRLWQHTELERRSETAKVPKPHHAGCVFCAIKSVLTAWPEKREPSPPQAQAELRQVRSWVSLHRVSQGDLSSSHQQRILQVKRLKSRVALLS